ncbi:MAG: hypothetical protein K6T65_04425 [Peptococcaceae bacterium]|nr:hypothetical protein [Peptococcaceae bacterium]
MSEISPKAVEQPASVSAMLEAEEWYDLLPVEKKLIAWSLGIGIVLLVIFILTFVVFK